MKHAVAIRLEIEPSIEHLVSSLCSCATNFLLNTRNMDNPEFPVKVFIKGPIGPKGLIGPLSSQQRASSFVPPTF